MKVRILTALTATAGMAAGASAADPVSANQKLADSVATALTTGGASASADVSIVAAAGDVTLSGTCRDAAQKAALLKRASVVRGVVTVRDGLSVATGVTQAQDISLPTTPFGPVVSAPVGLPVSTGGLPVGGPGTDPIPLGGAGADLGGGPPMPAHAWPTYAPYNNVSRVAYPQAYPYNAFPFIGPFYPFPKVPLGWRSVQLQWEDGHWWLGRTQAPQDYWRVRFW